MENSNYKLNTVPNISYKSRIYTLHIGLLLFHIC